MFSVRRLVAKSLVEMANVLLKGLHPQQISSAIIVYQMYLPRCVLEIMVWNCSNATDCPATMEPDDIADPDVMGFGVVTL